MRPLRKGAVFPTFFEKGGFFPQDTYGCFPWFSWNRKTSFAPMHRFPEENDVFWSEFLPTGFLKMSTSSQGI
jgi:hypothetical protein